MTEANNDAGRLVPPHGSGITMYERRHPCIYRRTDPDETEGRRMARCMAEKIARIRLGDLRIRLLNK